MQNLTAFILHFLFCNNILPLLTIKNIFIKHQISIAEYHISLLQCTISHYFNIKFPPENLL